MGRSQVKYRSTHGRGRGRGSGSASGERGGAAGSSSGGGASTRGQGGRRPLESNAFRYDEARDDNEEHDDNEPQDARTYSFRRQFFAGEDNVRDASATPSGAYFQTQTMKQWDADDDDDADVTSGKNAVGVLVRQPTRACDIVKATHCFPLRTSMQADALTRYVTQDFHWLGEQLAQVAPSVRYQMDPKYCVRASVPCTLLRSRSVRTPAHVHATSRLIASSSCVYCVSL